MAAPKRVLADLPDLDRQELEAWLVEFDQQWGVGALPERARRIPPDSSWRLPALCEMVKIDLERQWALGNRLSLETYLQDYPELGNPADVSADLIQAEYEVRKQFGAVADLDDYARRFPAQVDELRRLIASGRSSLSFRPQSASNLQKSVTRRRAHADTVQELPEQFGRYRILKRLGAGGMGSVYLAEDTRLKRKVALKVAHIGGSEGRQMLERFYREAEAAAGLDHPYLCKVHDVGEIENVHYLTMEYIEGTTLGDLIDGKSNLAQRQVAAIVGKLALALQEAHAKGVVHRDLKPANVMIKKTGQKAPVIVDFGLAQQLGAGGMRLTQTGQAMGTPYYMAIEQVKGDLDAIGPACDIYALGVILYELLTGVVPFDGPNPMVVIAQILTKQAAPPSTHRPDLDPKLEAICLKAMAKEIRDRYASMAELAAALTDYLKAPATVSTATPSGAVPASSQPETSPARPQGSDTLMGQFFGKLAVESAEHPIIDPKQKSKAKPIVPPVPELAIAGEDRGRWPRWPIIGALGAGFVVLLLGVVIYVATDKGRIRVAINDPKAVVKLDDGVVTIEELGEPIRLRAGKHALKIKWGNGAFQTREFVVRRGQDEPLRVEYVPRIEQEKPARTRKAAEPNPWPGALALAGQTLPVQGWFKAMSHDCRRVAVANDSKGVLVIEAPDASKVVELKEQPRDKEGRIHFIWVVTFSPDDKYIAVSLHDLPIWIWESASGEQVRRTSLYHATSLAYSPDGKRLAGSGREQKVAYVWDVAAGKHLVELGPHSATTDCVDYSPDGKRLASGSGAYPGDDWAAQFGTSADLKVWDLASGTGYGLEGHVMKIMAVAFSPDGKRLASASCDKTVKVWDLATKQCLVTFNKHQGFVKSVRFSPDGRLIASAGDETPVRVWDSATGLEVAILSGLPGNPEFVQFSPEGRWLYAGAKSTLKAWETPRGINSQSAEGTADSPRSGSITNSLGMKLVLIPAGEFLMGSPDDGNARNDEWPRHQVQITHPFYLGATEVTQGQYRTVTSENPSQIHGSDDLPVEMVTWFDTLHFCNALSAREGLRPFYEVEGEKVTVLDGKGPGYRLATEAEWEYACRAGTSTRYSFGDDARSLNEYAWVERNSEGKGHPVGQKGPNPFGLYDMHGNVWEWCWDAYDEKFYGQSPRAEPTGPIQGSSRTERGGSWLHDSWFARSAYRGGNPPTVRYSSLGFRVARNHFGHSGTDGSTGRSVDRFAPTLEVKPPVPIPVQPTDGTAAAPDSGSITNSLGMKLVLIPAGEFMMGMTPDAVRDLRKLAEDQKEVEFFDRQVRAAPKHRVPLTKPWFMGATEVTIGQFRKFVEAAKYVTEGEQYGFGDSAETKIGAKITAEQKKRNWRAPGYPVTDDSPLTQVTWNDAVMFCNWLNEQEKLPPCYQKDANEGWSLLATGEGYRLPTEAEWEYACQAGSTLEPTPGDGFAWLKEHACFNGDHLGGPQAVALRSPNAFGLFDMRGNVFEWCNDWYGDDYYPKAPPNNPPGPSSGDLRVQRGGAWSFDAIGCHSGFRTYTPQSNRCDHRGFRVVRVSTKAPSAGDAGGATTSAVERPARAPVKNPPLPEREIDAPKVGFQPLFNGKDLTGWKTHPKQPGNWHVANGILVGSGPAMSHLYTERADFQDFHLHVEARFNQGGSGGVSFRCPFGPGLPRDNPRWPEGYEATINSARPVRNNTGGFYPGSGKEVWSTDYKTVPFGQWFTLDLIANGYAFSILVDGKRSAYRDGVKPSFPRGHIALQQYGPGTVIEFRRIAIKELNRPDQKDPRQIKRFGNTGRVNRVAFSPDGQSVLAGMEHTQHSVSPGAIWFQGGGYSIRSWHVASGREYFHGGGEGPYVAGLALSSDGQFAVAYTPRDLAVWDIKKEHPIHKYAIKDKRPDMHYMAVSFAPDARRVLAATSNGNVLAWDLATGQKEPPIIFESGVVRVDEFPAAAFGSDRRYLVTGRRTGLVELWDLQEGKRLKTFTGHTGAVGRLAYSADGRLILSGGSDRTVRLWDVSRGKQLKQLTSDDRPVGGIALSPDGRRILYGDVYGSVYLCDAESGKEVCRMEGHTMGVNSVAFSPDGRRAVSGSDDKTVRLWQLPELGDAGGRPSKTAEAPTQGSVVKPPVPPAVPK